MSQETYYGKPLHRMSTEEKRQEVERIKAELERLKHTVNTIQTQKLIERFTETKRRLEQSYIPPSH